MIGIDKSALLAWLKARVDERTSIQGRGDFDKKEETAE